MKNKKSIRFLSLFSIIFFFTLGFLVTNVLNVKIQKQTQTIHSKAAGPIQEAQCTSAGGECQSGKLNSVGLPCNLSGGTPGIVKYNYCPTQEGDIRCCVPSAAAQSMGMIVTLQGIGPGQTIQTAQRTATIKVYDAAGNFSTAAFVAQDTITYDPASGNFINPNFNLGAVTAGDYQMVIQMNSYLDSQLIDKSDGDNKFTIEQGKTAQAQAVQMRAGDLAPTPNGDNHVNIIDYNAIIGCMPGAPESACINKKYADLNDDGVVDQKDLDILLSDFGQTGFEFQTTQFKCEPDPSCNSGVGALQLCSLLCSKKSLRG